MHKNDSLKKKGGKEKHTAHLSQPEPNRKRDNSGRLWYFLLALVMLVTLASYSNSLRNQFVFDDNLLITNNPAIRGVEKIPRLLGAGKKKVQYRPLRMISYAVDYTLNQKIWKHLGSFEGWDQGLNPLGYHLANCFYHLLTTWLVFLVVFRLAANYRIAFLAAALFALHPVHTDSVTYISGRRDIFVTLFYLAGFYYFLRYRQTGKIAFIVAALLSYLLSLGSKEMGVTLPALFLCYDMITQFPEKIRRVDGTYLTEGVRTLKKVLVHSRYLYSLIFLGALSFSYYKVFISSPSNRVNYYGDSMITTFLTVGKILVHYITLLVYPVRLNADYSFDAFPLSTSFLEPATVGAFMLLGVIGYVVLRLVITHRMAAFGVIWFFVTLLPVCHIFPHHELLAEHYLYLPSFGFCLLAGYLLDRLFKNTPYRSLTCASLILVFLLFSLRTVDRNRDWKDGFSLWSKTVQTAPRCARARNNLGFEYDKLGRVGEATLEYEQALAIDPQYAESYNNLGFIYYSRGRVDDAIVAYQKALGQKPRYAEAHNNLGAAFLKKGEIRWATLSFLEALKCNPRLAEAHIGMGVLFANEGRMDAALYQFKKAIEIKPYLAEAHNNLASTYYLLGDYPKAIEHANKVKELGHKVSQRLLEGLKPYR